MSAGGAMSVHCNICKDAPRIPTVTLCGHIYCWPCIKKWYELDDDPGVCPVCRRSNSKLDLIKINALGVAPLHEYSKVHSCKDCRQIYSEYERVLQSFSCQNMVKKNGFLHHTYFKRMRSGIWGVPMLTLLLYFLYYVTSYL